MVRVGRHRLEVTVSGSGLPAVVIEPCFGGWARDWRPIAEALAQDTTVVTYDRAPYGRAAESPSHYLNKGDPKLIISVIAEVVQSARTGAPPGDPVAASDGD